MVETLTKIYLAGAGVLAALGSIWLGTMSLEQLRERSWIIPSSPRDTRLCTYAEAVFTVGVLSLVWPLPAAALPFLLLLGIGRGLRWLIALWPPRKSTPLPRAKVEK